MTGEPLRQRVTVARQARQDGESCPMREGIGADGAPWMQQVPQCRPRLQRIVHPSAGCGDGQQDRFDAFHLGKAGEAPGVHPRRGEQLGRRANEPRLVRHLPQAEGHADFLI